MLFKMSVTEKCKRISKTVSMLSAQIIKPFSPMKGNDQENASMKLGSQ